MKQNTPPHETQYDDDFEIEGDIEGDFEVIDDNDDVSISESENEDEEHLVEVQDELQEEEIEVDSIDNGERAAVVFSKHKGSVFCCALSPKEDFAASGGEDDLAYVWSTETGVTLFECTGHKDSVTVLAFSHDGGFLATGDMNGFIQVWKVSTQTQVWQFETGELNWLIWHFSSNLLFAGTSEGEIWMWLIPQGNTKTFSHSGTSTNCGSLTRDGKRLCVGFADGSVKVFDLKSQQTLHCFTNHTQEVTSLACHQDNTLLMSGSADGIAKVYNSISGKDVATFNCMNSLDDEDPEESFDHTVEVVTFCPTIPHIAITASLAGVISIWDISSQASRNHIVQGCGTSCITWHSSKALFFSSGLDGVLRVYDARSAEQIMKFKGHNMPILCCDIKRDGNMVITGSDDGTVRLYKTENLFV